MKKKRQFKLWNFIPTNEVNSSNSSKTYGSHQVATQGEYSTVLVAEPCLDLFLTVRNFCCTVNVGADILDVYIA